MVEIKTTCCGEVICSGRTARVALETAVAEGVSLKYADLNGMWLTSVDLEGADLEYADLTMCKFMDANLRGANISHADVTGAYFFRADLRWLCHTGVNLQDWQIEDARCSGMWTQRDLTEV